MDSEFALPIFSHPDSSTFHLFVGFHYTLKQYGGWIRPVQLRCHYSTVQCIIELHEILQMWLRTSTTGGGSFPCNTDAIFNVFDNSLIFAMTLLFRYAYAPPEQAAGSETALLSYLWRQSIIINCFRRFAYHSQHPQGSWYFRCLVFPRQYRAVVHPSNYSVVVVFWTFVMRAIYIYPVIGVRCCKIWDIHPVLKKTCFFFSDTRFVIRAIYLPSLFQPLPRW